MTSSHEPRDRDDRSLPALLAHETGPVVVASRFDGWDRPWLALDETAWRLLAHEFGERVRCVTIETGANRQFALRHGLEIVPAVLVFLRGEIVARFSGLVQVAPLCAALRQALGEGRAREAVAPELESPQADRLAHAG